MAEPRAEWGNYRTSQPPWKSTDFRGWQMEDAEILG